MKHIFIFPSVVYNNEKSFYYFPVKIGVAKRIIAFSGSPGKLMLSEKSFPQHNGVTCLYIETSEEINQKNQYEVQILPTYLLWLATGLPTNNESKIKIDDGKSFDDIFKEYGLETSYNPKMRYGGGIQPEKPMERFVQYGHFLSNMFEEDIKKFENALQTFIWAREIKTLQNPHRRYSLYVTLFITTIEQLADERKIKECGGKIICNSGKCKDPNGPHMTSIIEECKNLIRRFITGENVEETVKKFGTLYSKVRSKYIHSGILSGNERDGGFLFGDLISARNMKIVEDGVNIENLARMLLELFLQESANKKMQVHKKHKI